MKKARMIIFSIFALSICLVFGIFLGRNLPGHYIRPAQSVIREEENILPAGGSEAAAISDGRLNLNTATQSQLMELPGIGEVLAKRILEYRQNQGPFAATEDLLNIKGIGEEKLEELDPFVSIGG